MREDDFASSLNRAGPLCWIDQIFERLRPVPFPFASVILALATHLVSVTPLLVSGQSTMVKERAFLLGIFGIMWVLLSTRMATRHYIDQILDFGPLISSGSLDLFQQSVLWFVASARNTRRYLVLSLAIWGIFVLLLALMATNVLDQPHFGFLYFLPLSWYAWNSGLLFRMLAVAIFAVPVILLIITTGLIMIYHIMWTILVQTFEFTVPAKPCFLVFQPMWRVSVYGSLAWGLGVSLIFLVFEGQLDPVRWALIIMLSMLGLLGLSCPVFFLRQKLNEIKMARIMMLHAFLLRYSRKERQNMIDVMRVNELVNAIDQERSVGKILPMFQYYFAIAAGVFLPFILGDVHVADFIHVMVRAWAP